MNLFRLFRKKKKKAKSPKKIYPARPWWQNLRIQKAIDPSKGIHFVGDLGANIGLGESARLLMRAMKTVGIPVAYTESVVTPLQRTETGFDDFIPPEGCDISLIHLNGNNNFESAVQQTNGRCVQHPYVIAYWYWELPNLPAEWIKKFRHIDELWVASCFVQDHIALQSPVPVVRIPLPLEEKCVTGSRSDFELPENRLIFLFVFDPTSSVGRKNPFAVVEAFRRAFAGLEHPPLLVLKARHVNLVSGQNGLVKDLSEALESIGGRWIGHDLSRDQMTLLMNCCDCFVSLHRCEGFGLGIAEALRMGKPVIATGYSSNMDFMTPDNSFPVAYRMTTVKVEDHKYQPEFHDYKTGEWWAEPDVEHAARLMRDVYDNPTEAARRGALAREFMIRNHSPETVGKRILERLDWIARRHSD